MYIEEWQKRRRGECTEATRDPKNVAMGPGLGPPEDVQEKPTWDRPTVHTTHVCVPVYKGGARLFGSFGQNSSSSLGQRRFVPDSSYLLQEVSPWGRLKRPLSLTGGALPPHHAVHLPQCSRLLRFWLWESLNVFFFFPLCFLLLLSRLPSWPAPRGGA